MGFLNPILGADLVVVRSTEARGRMSRWKREANLLPKHWIDIKAEIRSRYASTLVTHTVENPASEAKEVSFNLLLPDTAFVSRFAMVIGEEVFLAEVQEKKQALETYNEAVSKGQSAGKKWLTTSLIKCGKDLFSFVDTPMHSQVRICSCIITTQSPRTCGFERQGQQPVQHFCKRRGRSKSSVPPSYRGALAASIWFVSLPGSPRSTPKPPIPVLGSDGGGAAQPHTGCSAHHKGQQPGGEEKMVEEVALVREAPGRARVTCRPNVKDLEKLGKSLQFLLEYDVERVDGEVLLMDGHFVHFLAPDQLPVLKQHVVFVIDSSGSMSGRKMEQTKNAMVAILGQIGPTDFFSIIDFDSEVKDVLMAMKGTEKNIADAVEAVKTISASGATNIHGALLRALEIVDQAEMQDLQPLIVFLTDGKPTGITSPKQIQADVAARNNRGLAIFSLAFGAGADFEMLQKLSLQNHGFARKIYEGGDAAIQLQGFYREVASPLLSGVNFNYVGDTVEETSLTETTFHTFYKGSEMVVAGRLTGSEGTRFEYSVEGSGREVYSQSGHEVESLSLYTSRPMDKFLEVARQRKSQGFLERLWAFLRVRELLNKVEATEDEAAKAKALELALKYGFVTPLTSLVVVRQDEGQEVGQPEEEYLYSDYQQNLASNKVPQSNSFAPSSNSFDLYSHRLSSGVQRQDTTWAIVFASFYCLKFKLF